MTYGPNTEKAGGSRYSEGKPTMWCAPWLGMLSVCRVSTYGAEKYAPLDWKNGQSYSTLLNSAMRHMLAAMGDPLSRDEESGQLHLAHAGWNILTLLHFNEQGRSPELDDVTKWQGVTAKQRHQMEDAVPTNEVLTYDPTLLLRQSTRR